MAKTVKMKSCPESWKLADETLVAAFKRLEYADVNTTGTAAHSSVRDILYTLDIAKHEDAYRGLILKTLVADGAWSGTKVNMRASIDVLAVCAYFYKMEAYVAEDDAEDEEASAEYRPKGHQLKIALAEFLGDRNTKDSSTGYRTGELKPFSGKDHDWLFWKERAIARFKIEGLYEIIASEHMARLYPKKNTVIHGLLVEALLTTEHSLVYPCLMQDSRDNGHQAWKKLCELYEHKELIKNTCKTLHARFVKLRATKLEHWDSFTTQFLNTMNQMVIFQTKAKALDVDITGHTVNKWKDSFLDKLEIPLLSPRVDRLKHEESDDVWEVFLNLKGVILDKAVMKDIPFEHKQPRAKQDKKRKIDTGNEEEIKDPEAERTPRGNGDRSNATLQQLHSLIDKTTDATQKEAFKKMLADAKTQASTAGSNKKLSRFQKRKNRRTLAAGGSGRPVVDNRAIAIIGGDAGTS